jgi:hypothetical protein
MSEALTPTRESLLKQIIDAEWDMFRSVKASEPSACQEEEGTFRTMRWMSHSVLPLGLLKMQADHLDSAIRAGRNLMTEKYARMEGLVPPLSRNPHILGIVTIECAWMQALNRRYPLTFPGVGDRFQTYLACELETLSDEFLNGYHALLKEALSKEGNLVEVRYTHLFQKLGYATIEAREHQGRLNLTKCCRG